MLPDNQSQWPETPSPARRRGQRGAGVAATIVGVALFGVLVGVGVDRWAISTFPHSPLGVGQPTVTTGPRTGPIAAPNGRSTAQAAPTSTATTDPTQQAIQQVIQQGDDKQVQAFESNDPTVMQDTSTSDFYQSQVATNQDLASNGVTDIKLMQIEWGSVSVNGSTAMATAFETWSTTYSDGTTEQSRDRNVYTLVQQNGGWVISADDHPDNEDAGGAPGGQGQAPGGQASGVPGGSPNGQGQGQGSGVPSGRRGGPGGQGQGSGIPGGQGLGGGVPGGRGSGNPGSGSPGAIPQPRVPSQDVSANWSGYAATGGTYTSVSGTWSVPQFAPDSPAGADATWVGIGGVNTRDLIQAGTQQTVSGNGTTRYQAWVETLPQASHPVPLTVNPGDSISVAITQSPQAKNEWQVSYTNNTTGQTYQVTENYASSMSSAEWIEEAPSAARGRQIPLDNFGMIDFSQGSAVKDGQTVNIADAGATPITMVARSSRQTAKPSSLGADGGSFTVTQS
jgi:ketosteroid isomerase-like protein